jgi:acetolactate synthase I/II/III large subunit
MDISPAEVKRAASAQAPSHIPQELNGSDILVRCLQAEQVKYLWGYPGGAVLYIYDALYKQDKIQHILVRHEQAAVHAADGYARATGEVGVALVTSGPGRDQCRHRHRHRVHGLDPDGDHHRAGADAAIGLDAFQECDTVGITRPIVKHNFLVKDVRELAATMKKAFHIARTGRPGPVVVDIPKDVSLKTCAFHYPERVEMRSYNPVKKGHGARSARRCSCCWGPSGPMIYTGGGVILGNASNELRQLVDLLGFPCTNTLMGLGALPASDPRFLGMLGMHGTYEANMTMQNCDVLLAVGARFDDRVIGNPKHFASVERKIIHVDIDPSSISKRVKVDMPIVGDVKDVLQELIAQIKEAQSRPDAAALSAWWNQIGEWRKRECLKLQDQQRGHQAAVRGREALGAHQAAATPTSPPTSASTRCGPRSTTASTSRAAGSTPAAWARWAWACPMRWASSWPSPNPTCSASPAKARSRCASRSCRPASSTTRR